MERVLKRGIAMNTRKNSLALCVNINPNFLSVAIEDSRTESVSVFEPLSDAQRETLATDAWTVGLRALMNAYRFADESKLSDIGRTLVDDVDRQLKAYSDRQQTALVHVLQQYFDPRNGQVSLRIENFVKDGGDLAQAMEKYLSPEHGALAKTLARELGESSPLLKRLSPTDSEGLVCLLEARIQELVEGNSAAMAKALDPLSEDGAVSKLLRALRAEMEKADTDRTKQLAVVTKALDANDESSLLSRLIRETQSARTSLLQALNPDNPGSALAVLKTALTTMLETQAKTQNEALAAFEQRQRKLEQDIQAAVTRLEERKKNDAVTTRGGFVFEDAALQFVQHAIHGAPVVADSTGSTVGARPNCKVGDQVLRFTADSVHCGATVVIEVKRDGSYNATKALQELEIARSNRGASVGVFIMSRSHAPIGFPAFARYGNDVLVIWDDQDESTDPYLHAAILLGLGLATRQLKPSQEGNIDALADIESRIQKELTRHQRMQRMAENIKKNADDLSDELRIGSDKMNVLIRNAKDTLKALNVELTESTEERGQPIALPVDSLSTARALLATG